MNPRIKSCEFCDATFVYKYNYNKHYLNVHKLKPYPCVFCHKRFINERCLKVHYMYHTNERPHSCDDCNESFTQSSALKWHRKRQHPDKLDVSPADESEELCIPESSLSDAMKSKELGVSKLSTPKEKPYKCNKCGKDFSIETALDIHYFHEHPDEKLHFCPDCNTNFVDGKTLRNHIISCHYQKATFLLQKKKHVAQNKKQVEYKPYKCDKCEKDFFLKKAFDVHYFNEHPEDRLYSCQDCNKSYVHERYLIKHFSGFPHFSPNGLESSRKRCKREVCTEIFQSSADFQDHKLSHVDQKPLVCTESFLEEQDFNTHIPSREENKSLPYVCRVCKKRFPDEVHLRVHLLSHTDKKPNPDKSSSNKTAVTSKMPYICKQCNEGFFKKIDVLSHIVSHWDKRCQICDETFSKKFDLHVHGLIHTDDFLIQDYILGKYPCDVCTERFSKEVDLRVHSLSHSKLYTCNVCGETYISEIDLKVHNFSHKDRK